MFKKPDLILLHPPSIYDFRERNIFYGPVSDLIPSSPVFEMYPLGFLTIQDYLEERGHSVRIINLALKMLRNRDLSVREYLAGFSPEIFGIDLHWLPHAHGSLEIARIIREEHPDTPIVMGGLSASYFHEELIEYPQVDYVLRGDCTEEPFRQLLKMLKNGDESAKELKEIDNLTWKCGGENRINLLTFNPDDLDYADLSPHYMVKNVFKYRDFEGVIPYDGWQKNPVTTVFSVKGCTRNCVTCGRSSCSNEYYNGRSEPIFRSPESLVKNIRELAEFSRGPIFIIGDLREGGKKYSSEVLAGISRENIKNEIIFELFEPASEDFLRQIAKSVESWTLELSPESHSREVRSAQEAGSSYSNADMERCFSRALQLGCSRLDVFFMIGLPRQTPESVQETVDYCAHLFKKFDDRLSCFISPMGPFLDPASRAFEAPEDLGYRKYATTLEDHREMLEKDSWKNILSYETKWMSREEIVDQTYIAAEKLNDLKYNHGRIDKRTRDNVKSRLERVKNIKKSLQENSRKGRNPKKSVDSTSDLNICTVCGNSELLWPSHLINFKPSGIIKQLLR